MTNWSILQQYFSSPLPILLYVMGWHELLQGYKVTNGYSMLQSPLQRLAQINSKCEMPQAPSLRARGLEGRPREGGGAGGTPWNALGRPGRPWGLESLGQAVADAAGSGSGSQKSGLCCA